jgi:hypothetical protein
VEKVTIKGQEYELVFNMYAVEQIQDKIGSLTDVMARIQDKENIDYKLVRQLFVILANTAREARDLPEDVTDKPLKRMHIQDFQRSMLWAKIVIEIANGWKSETTGGNEADNEKHDVWLEEDEKNGATGAR